MKSKKVVYVRHPLDQDLNPDVIDLVDRYIANFVWPVKRRNRFVPSSYGFKHRVEGYSRHLNNESKTYVSNADFKAGMARAGYEVIDANGQNTYYRVNCSKDYSDTL